jgi:hypothetical protein
MANSSTLLTGLLLSALGTHAQALTGTVTVGGTSPNYPTLTAAVTDLQSRGVGAGGLTVAIRPGTYSEPIVLNSLSGTSAANPVRFVGRGGIVTLRPLGTSASTDAAVSVTASSFVTFDSLNVADGGTSAANQIETGYFITGTGTQGSTNNTVSNCAVQLGGGSGPASTSTRGVYMLSVATAASGANNNNRILNVRVDKASTGVRLAGRANLSGQPTFPDSGNEVRGCVLGAGRAIAVDGASGSAAGISVGAQRAMRLLNNRIDSVLVRNSSPILPTNASAFSLDNASGRIEGNRVSYVRYGALANSLAQGIRASVILGDTLKIFNNFLGGISRVDFTAGTTDNTIYALGIWLFRQAGGGGLTQAFHNTIVLPAAPAPVAYSSAGFYLSGGSTGPFPAELLNNIIINRLSTSIATQGAFAVVDGNSARGNLLSNFNVLFAPGINGAVGQTGRELGGTRVTSVTLADWRTNAATDASSVSKAVAFVNEAVGDLHLATPSIGDQDLAGTPVAAVSTDIDGAPRSRTLPYRGADEAAVTLRTVAGKAAALGVQAYPNPAARYLRLRYAQPGAGSATVLVLDALGRPVRRLALPGQPSGRQEYILDMEGLLTGVYVVQVAAPGTGGTQAIGTVRVSLLP